ncbi:MAG: potassium-transporting ATPase subunit KdpA [Polyangiales bacterium]
MSAAGWLQLALYFALLVALAAPLGAYLARVYEGEATLARRVLGPVERWLYRAAGVRADEEMRWQRYATATVLFTFAGALVTYGLQRLQGQLPLNPRGLGAVAHPVAFNTAVSFTTNTNWQAYGGETTLSHLTQLLALTTQNFVSAATGMAVAVALLRGFTRRGSATLGNFWVDLTRGTLYVLLPLSLVLALLLASQGVVQTLAGSVDATLVDPLVGADGHATARQTLALGPAASQVAIKQLGTNGGGFFNVNSAHPFENPTAVTNLLESLALLLLPAAWCFAFGRMVRDRRQGYAIAAAMLALLLPLLALAVGAELAGNGALASPLIDATAGNMEGKEQRFGVVASALWSVATTASSNGSVNAMHDSFTPLGGLAPMVSMLLGEVAFGGVGSGLYGMLMFALLAVFVAGLMVGRTPEYLGKKVEAFEVKMASLAVLIPAAAVLLGAATACAAPAGARAVGNPGGHGFSEVLYAFASGANNNGSAFGGLDASGPFYGIGVGLAMMVGRFGVIVPVLAVAGSLAKKRAVAASAGTLPTHSPLFVALLVGVVVLVGALTFVPALALGPVAEHLTPAPR